MTTHRGLHRTSQAVSIAAIIGLLSACGGSDDPAPAADPVSATAAVEASEIGEAAAEADPEPEAEAEAAPPAAPSGAGSATLSLDNGESFQFSVLCSLEPQIAAGSEILFSATSYDDPGFDVTQFGDEGPVTGAASISVYDSSYEVLWEANSIAESFGGSIALSLDGSTINGTGSFYPAADYAAAPVAGTLVANC